MNDFQLFDTVAASTPKSPISSNLTNASRSHRSVSSPADVEDPSPSALTSKESTTIIPTADGTEREGKGSNLTDGMGVGPRRLPGDHSRTTNDTSPAVNLSHVAGGLPIMGPLRSLFLSGPPTTLPLPLLPLLSSHPRPPSPSLIVMKRAAEVEESLSNRTVSPQEAFLDYEEIDRLNNTSSYRSKGGSNVRPSGSLFAPLPSSYRHTTLSASISANTLSKTNQSNIPPIIAASSPRINGHRPAHPFSVPQNAVSWVDSGIENSNNDFNNEDGGMMDYRESSDGEEDEEELERLDTPPPAAITNATLPASTMPDAASSSAHTTSANNDYSAKARDASAISPRQEERAPARRSSNREDEELRTTVYDSSRFPSYTDYVPTYSHTHAKSTRNLSTTSSSSASSSHGRQRSTSTPHHPNAPPIFDSSLRSTFVPSPLLAVEHEFGYSGENEEGESDLSDLDDDLHTREMEYHVQPHWQQQLQLQQQQTQQSHRLQQQQDRLNPQQYQSQRYQQSAGEVHRPYQRSQSDAHRPIPNSALDQSEIPFQTKTSAKPRNKTPKSKGKAKATAVPPPSFKPNKLDSAPTVIITGTASNRSQRTIHRKHARSSPPADEEGLTSEYEGILTTDTPTSKTKKKGSLKRQRIAVKDDRPPPSATHPGPTSLSPPNSTLDTTSTTSQCNFLLPTDPPRVCGVIFRRPYDLNRHEETIHGLAGKNGKSGKVTWVCKSCKGLFSRKDALIRHSRLRGHPSGL
jgi:hypothetical protein